MATTAGRPRVSLNMIVRDEEANLPDCLGPVRHLFDEIVVIDTGSADRTRQVAAALGATVFEFPWRDDFAAARNAALERTTGDYVLWLDADDRIDAANQERLARLLGSLSGPPAGYLTRYRCHHADPGGTAVIPRLQLFPRLPGLRWRYRAHAQIAPSLQEAGVAVRWSDVAVDHTGLTDPSVRGRKTERYLRLARLTLEEHPGDPFALFNMGSALLEAGRPGEAVGYLRGCVAGYRSGSLILPPAYARLAECLRRLGRPGEALAACREGLGRFPGERELRFVEGFVRAERGDLAGAEGCFRALVEGPGSGEDAWGDFVRAGHNLGLVYARWGKADAAVEVWRRVLGREPGYQPTWVALGELALGCQEWATAG